ncbi:MAG: tetratricopeptide repeat protein [Lewinella sp.]|nr:tetratricopeptide repeat protein [Lewinella sp.]
MKIYAICLTVLFAAAAGQAGAQVQYSENQAETERLFLDAYQRKIEGKIDEAINIYKEVFKIDERSPVPAYELARIYFAKSEADEAIRWAKIAADLDPANVFYDELLADIYHTNGRYEEAAQVYEGMIKNQPFDESLYFKLAYQWVKSNDIPKALKVYDDLEKKTGVSEELARRKQALYMGTGDTKKAGKELEKLVLAFPKNMEYRHLLAGFYLQTGNDEAAEKVYRQILEIDPSNPRAMMALAGQQSGNSDEARYLNSLKPAFGERDVSIDLKIAKILPFINKVAEKGDPALADAVLELTAILETVHPGEAKAFAASGDLLYHSGRYELALEKYRKALDLDDSVFAIWEQTLFIYARAFRYQELAKAAESAIDIFPNRGSLYYLYGLAQLELGDPEDAISLLDQALLMSSADPLLRQGILAAMGQAQSELGRYEDAARSFGESLSLNPNNPETLARQSLALNGQDGQNQQAREAAEKALKIAPQSALCLDAMGWSLYHSKKWPEARQQLEKALSLSQERDPRILEHYGDLLFQAGEQDRAIEFWQKARTNGRHTRLLDRKINEKKLIE